MWVIGVTSPAAHSRCLDATLSHGVEEVLAEGVALSTNPYLGDSNVACWRATRPRHQRRHCRYLEEALGATGRQGLIHASPPVVAGWAEYLHIENEMLLTINGTPVASGSGYIGASSNGNIPSAGTAYAFVTGPVQVRVSEPTLVGD